MATEASLQLSERAYRRADLEALVRIESQSGESAWSPEDLERWLAAPNLRVRVITLASAPDEPLAFYVLSEEVVSVYLANLAVAPAWRRKGVGTFALENITAWCRQRRRPFLELHVREDNLGAQLLYKANGFVAVEIARNHYRTQDGYGMRKKV